MLRISHYLRTSPAFIRPLDTAYTVRTATRPRGFFTMPPKTLNFHAGPMVWIDCEMTGLNPRKDKIIEIAVRFSSVL